MRFPLSIKVGFVLTLLGWSAAHCLGLPGAVTVCAEETDRIQELTVEQAQRLAQDKSGRLLLDGLKSLSPEVATELARHEGWLSLGVLTTISDEAATALGQHKGALHLDGLTRISDAAVAARTTSPPARRRGRWCGGHRSPPAPLRAGPRRRRTAG